MLPKISSNVSVYPTEPDADPLGDWLMSLAYIKSRVPDDVLVLPAHNAPFRGMHSRVDQLVESHRRNLVRLEDSLAVPRRAVDVFDYLFLSSHHCRIARYGDRGSDRAFESSVPNGASRA